MKKADTELTIGIKSEFDESGIEAAQKAVNELREADGQQNEQPQKKRSDPRMDARAEKESEKAERAREKAEQKEEKGETKEREIIESRAEVQRRIKRELEEIERDCKTSGRYTEKEKRLQADIYAQDWKALMARREHLQVLQNTPGMDSERQSAINKKLRETDMQLRGLRDNMKRASRESQKAVVGLKPLGQQAKNKGWQGTLKRVEKAYVSLAQRAERQASKGDEKALARTVKAMRRNALQQEKLTGYSGRATAQQKTIENHLKNIARGTSRQDRGLTAEQRKQNAIHQALEGKRKYAARGEKAARRAALYEEKNAKLVEKESREEKKTNRTQKRTERAEKRKAVAMVKAARAAEAEAKRVRNQGRKTEAVVGKYQEAINTYTARTLEIVQLVEKLGKSIKILSAASARGFVNCARELSSIKRDIEQVKKAIDKLRRIV